MSAAPLISACTDPAGGAGAVLADSAGIVIVTQGTQAASAAESWSLAPGPAVEVGGGADPDVPLHRVSAVEPLAGGGVAIGINDPARVLLFDAAGGLETEVGRAGEGPGEFARVTSVVAGRGDSIAVWDADRRRLSFFARDGRHSRDVDLSGLAPASPRAAPGMSTPAGYTRVIALGPDSYVLFVAGLWSRAGDIEGPKRTSMSSVQIDARGRVQATYGPFPGLELFWIPGLGPLPYPLGADLHAAASGSDLVVGTGELPELRFYDSAGDLNRLLRWNVGDRAVEGSRELGEFRAWLDQQLSARDPRERELFRGALGAIPEPVLLPAYRDLIGDASTGDVWVGSYPGQLDLPGITPEVRPVPERQWWIFGRDGALRATAITPARYELRAVRDGTAWGVYRDGLDIETVRGYRISPSP